MTRPLPTVKTTATEAYNDRRPGPARDGVAPAAGTRAIAAVDRSATPPATFDGKIIQDPTTAGQPQLPADAVRLMTPDGQQVFNPYSGNHFDTAQYIYFPSRFPPDFYIQSGLSAKEQFFVDFERDPIDAFRTLAFDLYNFRQNGPWDAQRTNGVLIDAYVDYATVAIGLWGAAANISEDEMLTIENEYARRYSKYSDPTRDSFYTYLPPRNVENTRIGYRLFQLYRK